MSYLSIIPLSFAAGFLYIFSPGPVFIGLLSLVASEGRKQGLILASGAFLGDLVWLLLTYAFLIGANQVPAMLTIVLNLSCGAYLLYIAARMLKSLGRADGTVAFKNPWRDGVTLGLLNPKSYPVAISLFSSLLYTQKDALTIDSLPLLMISAALGMILAYLCEIFLAGIPKFRTFYQNNKNAFTVAFAVIFIFFGLSLWVNIFRS